MIPSLVSWVPRRVHCLRGAMAAEGGVLGICAYVEVFIGSLGMVLGMAAMICVSFQLTNKLHKLLPPCVCVLFFTDGAVLCRGTGGTQY